MARTNITTLANPEYITATLSSTVSGAADTYVDVAGSTIVLPQGDWELTFEGPVYLENKIGSSLAMYGNVGIFNSANVLQDSALALLGQLLPSNSSFITYCVLVAKVSGGTYKLRIRSNNAFATGVIGVITGNDFTGSLTNPDYGPAKLYARRVGS
jgi:hypothetical protein